MTPLTCSPFLRCHSAMAVAVYEFTIVVPLASIEKGFPRGVLGWLSDVGDALGKSVWFDDRLAAMSYYDRRRRAPPARPGSSAASRLA